MECIIGKMPPPIGGVSIFLKRYCEELNQKGKAFEVLDFTSKNMVTKISYIFKILCSRKFTSIFVNSSNINILMLLTIRIPNSKIIYYDHNFRLIEKLNVFQKYWFKLFLKRITELRVVNEKVCEYYEQHIKNFSVKVKVKNAFIKPTYNKNLEMILNDDAELQSFINNTSPKMISNAAALNSYNGTDIYGIDLLLIMLEQLVIEFKHIGLIIAVAKINNEDYFSEILKMVKEKGLSKNIYFHNSNNEIYPLFKKVDLLIRPTFSDGDAISIREALSCNCSVLASDCVTRPEGTKIFENRNALDLIEKSLTILKKCSVVA